MVAIGALLKAVRPARVRSQDNIMSETTARLRCVELLVMPHKAKRRKKRLMMVRRDHVYAAACHKNDVEVHLTMHAQKSL